MNLLQKIIQSKTIERIKRAVGKATGLHVRIKRFTASASEEMRVAKLLDYFSINYVIDIGANTGQFAESLYDFGYKGKVVSFEPVASVYKQLEKRSKKYQNWIVAPRCAIGGKNGTAEIYVSNDTVFSSIKKIKDSYVDHNPKSKIMDKEEVPLHTIDSCIRQFLSDTDDRILLKIDTQGFEEEVLSGAEDILSKCLGIKIEIPLYPIYDDSEFTFFNIIEFLKNHNFQPYSFNIEGVDLPTGRVNTMDGLFFKESYATK